MIKRLFDILVSFFGLLLLSPVLVVVAVWVKIDSSGPVFFRQQRVGLHGVVFSIHKFRTMKVGSETSGRLTIGDDSRVTVSGYYLRKLKIDELPQLIDVLIGKMSLVGPRPEVQEFMDHYPKDVRQKILSVRPGITDRASIEMMDENELLASYSNPKEAYINIVMPLKQSYYLDYVDNHNLIIDVCLILKTVFKIVSR